MGNTGLSDSAVQRIQEALSRAQGVPVRVTGSRKLSGGACQMNLRLDAVREDGAGPVGPWVLRADAATSLPMSLRRRDEVRVMEAAAAAGVRTPAPLGFLSDVPRPGRDAVLLPHCDGETVGSRVVAGAALEDARRRLPEELAAELARIHTIRPSTHEGVLPDMAGDPVDIALSHLRALAEGLASMRPALAHALRWLEDNPPPDREPVLVHGDYRVGNFMVDAQGLVAVLDWEFAHWGVAAEDAAWLMVRDWRFSRPELPVGGLCGRARFLRAYAGAAGRELTGQDIRFWEVYGNVRWAAGCHFQTMRVLAQGERNLELLAISRRAEEMEYEALRLITQAET